MVDQFQPITLSQSAIDRNWTFVGGSSNTVTGPVSSVTDIAISSNASGGQVNNLTIGSIDSSTTVTGFDAVTLGTSPTGGISSLLGIRRPVTIGTQVGQTTQTSLTLDDAGGTVGPNWTIGPTEISIPSESLTPITINWTAQLQNLSVLTGGGNDRFAINQLPAPTNLNAGPGDDQLTVDFAVGDPIPANTGLVYDGGQGINSLSLMGGSFTEERYRAFSTTDGSISLDDSSILFLNLSPILDTVAADDFTFVAPDGTIAVNITDGQISQGFQTTMISSGDTPAGFELIEFANKTTVLIDLSGIEPFNPPGQLITLNTPTAATGLASLSILSSISDDQINVLATAPGVSTSVAAGLGDDQISVLAAGLGDGGSISFDGGPGADTLTIDAGGAAVSFTVTTVNVVGAPPISLTEIEQVNIINAANPPLTPISTTIQGNAGFPISDVLTGQFTDADTNASAGNYSATIDWGDGSAPTTGTVTQSGSSTSPTFGVVGSHTYFNGGDFPVTVNVVDRPITTITDFGNVIFSVTDVGGATTIDSLAVIASPTINATPLPITVIEDQSFTRPLVSFTTTFPGQSSEFVLAVGITYTATIDWGDGTPPSPGTVIAQDDGSYRVDGTHLYLKESAPGKPYVVTVTILDPQNVATTVRTTATVLSNDIVTTEADSGPGSLRFVILDVNADQIPSTITFNIPGAGAHRIVPTSPLPVIAAPVFIDGSSQPGFQGEPLIELSGNQAGPGADGLTLAGGMSTVKSLVINRFAGVGLVLEGTGGNRVVGNRIGTDLSGTQPAGNGNGILIQESSGNTIGGLTRAERNIISGNRTIGINLSGSGSVSNDVIGNFIGTDVTGQGAVPNFQGIVILGAARNRIGGPAPGSGNVISGNASAGIQIFNDATVFNGQPIFNPPGVATGNVIQGNLIGLDANGTGRLGNAQGIFINDASGNLIGGSTPEEGNVIAGNRSIGIQILGDNATGNAVIGNFIGTNRAGARGLGNSVGVFVYARTGNVVGPAAANATEGNVIRFNTTGGVESRSLSQGPQIERSGLLSAPSGATRGLVLTFTTYLDAQRVLNPANYVVATIGRNFRPGPRIPIAGVTYDEIFRTVTVTFARPIPRNVSFRFRLVGTAPGGLTDRAGNFLDGNPDAVRRSTGSDFQATFIQGVEVQTSASRAKGKRPIQRGPRRLRPLLARSVEGPKLGRGLQGGNHAFGR